MGQEIACVAQFSGKRGQGKVLLETKEIIFRGDFRLKIPFSSIREVKTANGELRLKTPEGVAVFEIGPKAETWRDKILNPKSLVQKLGIKAGETVTMRGAFSREFRESLKKHGAKIGTSSSPPWILFAAETSGELKVVKSIARSLQGAAALWIVFPKGQKTITEHDVRGAGLKAGLTDVKVASFSETNTALKFVIPKANR